ncbi:MAG: hypothetical protein V4661_12170 [Pseudomonadota bacterium]
MSEKTRTPHGQAQFEKKQVAAREGEKAMAHYDAQGRAARINMEKLKALRLAKEAAEAAIAPVKKPAAKKKKSAAGVAPAEAPKLSEWLAGQEKGGHRR